MNEFVSFILPFCDIAADAASERAGLEARSKADAIAQVEAATFAVKRWHYSGTMPVTGNVTSQIDLWDAGTEVNQPPGEGADQAALLVDPLDTAAIAAGISRIVGDQ